MNGEIAAASASLRMCGHWRRRCPALIPGQSLIRATGTFSLRRA
jgi:hypothetical protein